MQITKIRKACCGPVRLMNGVKFRTVMSDSPVCCLYHSIQLKVSRKSSQSGLAR